MQNMGSKAWTDHNHAQATYGRLQIFPQATREDCKVRTGCHKKELCYNNETKRTINLSFSF